MFKKRVPKGNIRSKVVEADDAGEDQSVLVQAREMREEQEERKRVSGVNLCPKDKSSNQSSSDDPDRSISSMMTGQYKMGKEDLGAVESAHAAIMEKYIAEKLGAGKDDSSAAKKRGPDDELYVVPDNIKLGGFTGNSEKNNSKSSSGYTLVGGGTGLAEVLLPDDYKLRNIQETEGARKALEERNKHDQEKVGNMKSQSHYRYSDPNNLSVRHPPHITLPEGQWGTNGSNAKPDNFAASTDDATVRRFVKRLKH